MEKITEKIIEWATGTGVKIIVALVVLLFSFRIITVIFRKIEKKAQNSKKLDKTLSSVLLYVSRIALKILVVICLIGYLGIDTSGLTALIASLGVCAGLAVNGALSNLAGGALLLITRPFKIDDYIETQGYEGTVEDIHIISTKLRTVDNKVVYIPNGAISSGTIVNYSEKELRRVDLDFSVSYENDFEKAEKVVLDLCKKHPLILESPEPFARVSSHADNAVIITMRAWTKNSDYWAVRFDLMESVKKEFDKNGISIPYNQLDVHVKN